MEQQANSEGRSIRVHLDDNLLRSLEAWRKRQVVIPSRASAVRRALALALANEQDAPLANRNHQS
jgi:hypothetical protein